MKFIYVYFFLQLDAKQFAQFSSFFLSFFFLEISQVLFSPYVRWLSFHSGGVQENLKQYFKKEKKDIKLEEKNKKCEIWRDFIWVSLGGEFILEIFSQKK